MIYLPLITKKQNEKRDNVRCHEQPERRGGEIGFHDPACRLFPLHKKSEYSLHNMRERDMAAVMKSDYFKQLLIEQHRRIGKKAFPIICSSPTKARSDVDTFMEASGEHFDLVLVDMPGTVNSEGVITTIVNVDYVVMPVIPDSIVLESSISFSTSVLGFIRKRPGIALKDVLIFWNRVDRRTSPDIYDAYRRAMEMMNLTVLNTVIPETHRYDKELRLRDRSYFRCSLLPPPARLLKGSGLEELAEELCEIFKL